jgi:hypothetical protein
MAENADERSAENLRMLADDYESEATELGPDPKPPTPDPPTE